MKALFTPLCDPESLPRRALVIAPHPDDEVLGVGGLLAFHAQRGDDVRVVLLSDGAGGDPGGEGAREELVAARRAESIAACQALGVSDLRFLDLPDGGLSGLPDLVRRVATELEDFDPDLVYAPSPQEQHPDHRAASRAALAALSTGRERRALLYGVNRQVTGNVLFDTTRFWFAKQAALERFTTQLAYHDLVGKCEAVDRSRVINVEDPEVRLGEGFADVPVADLARYEGRVARLLDVLEGEGHGLEDASSDAGPRAPRQRDEAGRPTCTAVISTWNKSADVCANLDAIRAQTEPFEEVVVVDNASSDDTVERVSRDYPEVRLIVMPHSDYGACETFNIGFASVRTPLLAILDDDVVLAPEWLEKARARLAQEPETTAVVSTNVLEPGMPESYLNSPLVTRERYTSTFRGCASLARLEPLRRAGFYDERLFLYGNERDLTCRLFNLGCRVLQYPGVDAHHSTPFGIKLGRRSLYYHARNAFLTQLKYAPLGALLRLPFLAFGQVVLRGGKREAGGEVADAVGTIGIGRSLRETPGAWRVLAKAAFSVLWNVPYCLERREPCTAPDFELPLK